MAAIVGVAAGAAFLVGTSADEEYRARAYAIYAPIPVEGSPPPYDPTIPAASQYQGHALGVVAADTARAIGGGLSRDDVLDKVETDYDFEASLLAIDAVDGSPRRAARIANAFSQAYVRYWDGRDRDRLETALTSARGRLRGLTERERAGAPGRRIRERIGEIERHIEKPPGGAWIGRRADVPVSPSSPTPASRAAAGAGLGLLLAIGLVTLLERRRPS